MKTVNKTIAYAVIAILLGTVTMVAPLALLGPNSDYIFGVLDGKSGNENTSQEIRNQPDSSFLDANQFGEANPPPSGSYGAVTETSSDPSQIGLLVIPSFLVALAFFVLFKKRI